MAEIFHNLPKVRYEGSESKNPLAFKYFNPDREIMGKKMSEHLPFAMAWWHNLCATGTDMFARERRINPSGRSLAPWRTRRPRWMLVLSLWKSSV